MQLGKKKRSKRLIIGLIIFLCMSLLYTPNSSYVYATEQEEEIEEELVEIKAEEIDLGDYESEMVVGERQLLTITVLPLDVTNQEVSYASSNENVAKINGMGRITALKSGNTVIKVSCGKITEKFNLKVVEPEPETEEVVVNDIEIGEYETELEVGKTMSLTATAVPEDAVKATIQYKSLDETIATVSSSGEVKGISKGTAVIEITAGNITKTVELIVKVATTKIEVDTSYLVVQSGEEHQLQVQVLPAEADQEITYKSMDATVATVTEYGMVTAKKSGSTVIIVKNKDISTSVTVIVNEKEEKTKKENKTEEVSTKEEYSTTVTVEECPTVSKEVLKQLYERSETLTVYGKGYILQIKGEDIRNYENELNTCLELEEVKEGMTFVLNANRSLCGMVSVQFDEGVVSGKYVYLYNQAKQKYEQLNVKDMTALELDKEGTYLITSKKLSTGRVRILVIVIVVTVVIVLLGIYIAVKKQYWFW